MARPFKCPHCEKAFATDEALYSHARAKHKALAHSLRPARFDEGESYADQTIEAEQLRDAGLPVPADIRWLLGEV